MARSPASPASLMAELSKAAEMLQACPLTREQFDQLRPGCYTDGPTFPMSPGVTTDDAAAQNAKQRSLFHPSASSSVSLVLRSVHVSCVELSPAGSCCGSNWRAAASAWPGRD